MFGGDDSRGAEEDAGGHGVSSKAGCGSDARYKTGEDRARTTGHPLPSLAAAGGVAAGRLVSCVERITSLTLATHSIIAFLQFSGPT